MVGIIIFIGITSVGRCTSLLLTIRCGDNWLPLLFEFPLLRLVLILICVGMIIHPVQGIPTQLAHLLLILCSNGRLHFLVIAAVANLIAIILQLIACGDHFQFLLILRFESFGIADNLSELVLAETGSSPRLDGDTVRSRMILCILGVNRQDTVCIHIERHLNLRDSS